MYRYRCEQCRVTSTPVRTLGEVHTVRAMHRDAFHGGLTPDGEDIVRPVQPPGAPDWRIAALVLAGAVIAALANLIHHL